MENSESVYHIFEQFWGKVSRLNHYLTKKEADEEIEKLNILCPDVKYWIVYTNKYELLK